MGDQLPPPPDDDFEGAPTPPSGNPKPWLWLLGAVLVIGLISWPAISEQMDADRPISTRDAARILSNSDTRGSTCRRVIYYVEGTATGADITMIDGQGNISQGTGKGIPLKSKTSGVEGVTIGCVPGGTFVSISAQNTGESGTVICRIEADGTQIARTVSDGAYVIASCSASVP